ncbi:unnamed protein product [Adineta steineri]|uniref:Uncharacterized protein n=1 Tax=Adineta steineri TaxID=433720 RepID=A0A814SH70_9BILA|nr:unnamed protein product [Adineta steineri]CAF4044197.1 unnamed protein product [Adineta steineri]
MTVFGYLAYQNIRLTRALAEQQADRQLTRMILIETALVTISYMQYGINGAYTVITARMSKDANRLQIENFVATLSNLGCYLYFSGSCYAFLLSSSRFRKAAKKLLFFWQNTNQIHPNGTLAT